MYLTTGLHAIMTQRKNRTALFLTLNRKRNILEKKWLGQSKQLNKNNMNIKYAFKLQKKTD